MDSVKEKPSDGFVDTPISSADEMPKVLNLEPVLIADAGAGDKIFWIKIVGRLIYLFINILWPSNLSILFL